MPRSKGEVHYFNLDTNELSEFVIQYSTLLNYHIMSYYCHLIVLLLRNLLFTFRV